MIRLKSLPAALRRLGKDRPSEQHSGFTRPEIVFWWESRRFAYNLVAGIIGIASWFSVLIFGSLAVKPGVDFEEPLGMIFGPFLWAFLANVCYTSGWLLDIVAYRGEPRRKLFQTGLLFSILLTALPGSWAVLAWLITLATGNKDGLITHSLSVTLLLPSCPSCSPRPVSAKIDADP
jgi:hypothetical protein